MNLYVILYDDLVFEDIPQLFIGVASDMANVDKMIADYFGEHEVLNVESVQDSGIEQYRNIQDKHGNNYLVTVLSCQLNETI